MKNEVLVFKERAGKPGGGKGILIGEDKTFTLSTMQQDTICYSVENHPNDSRVKIREDGTVQTLSARCGTGGGNTPCVCICCDAVRRIQGNAPDPESVRRRSRGGSEGLILIIDSHPTDSRFDVFSDQITPTITRHVVKGGSEGPLILEVTDGVSERGKRAVSADNDEEDSEHT